MLNAKSDYRFSIIIPLEFHRGQVEACLRRWVREQTFAREKYEVIAAGCRSSLGEAALTAIRAELGPHDRLLLYDDPHDIALCAHAAREAAGEILFFSESHVLPEPDVLSLSDARLRAYPKWAGFSCRSLRIVHNRLSVVEADMYEADIRYGMEQHPWRKILDQCFVVRAGRYRAAGGFLPELGHFAEWYLAARMYAQGDRIGYAPEIKVWHYYVGDIRELVDFSADFTRGEMLFHSSFDGDPCRAYFAAPAEWQLRGRWMPALARRVASLTRLIPGLSLRGDLRRTVRRFWWRMSWNLRARIGIAPALIPARIRFYLAYWALRIGVFLQMRSSRLQALFLRLLGATVSLERLRCIDRWMKESGVMSPTISSAAAVWGPDETAAFRSAGIHPAEEWQGQRFRWSEPVGMVELSLTPGCYRFEMRWLPLGPGRPSQIYLDESPIQATVAENVAIGEVSIGSTQPVRLAWTCAPWETPGDPRLLGLPLTSISWMQMHPEA